MTKIKKIILTVVSLLFLIGVGFVALSRKEKGPESPPKTILKEPAIPSYVKGRLPITISLNEENVVLPTELPLLKAVFKKVSEEEMTKTARALGLETAVQKFSDVKEGTKYLWADSNAFLVITPSRSTLKYGLSSPPFSGVIDKDLDDGSLIELAKEFLNKALGEAASQKVNFSSLRYLKEDRASEGLVDTERESAEIFQINFTYLGSNREIITIEPNSPLVFVQLLADGRVFNSQIIILEGVEEAQLVLKLKNFQEVVLSLPEAKLIGLTNDYINLPDVPINKINSIQVDSIKTVYLLDQVFNLDLQPVFVLEGDVKVEGSVAKRALLLLPAVSKSQP